jgi:NAD(P)-dependent dehydrogenase (short-subunit alcohol dehydrogenase family)
MARLKDKQFLVLGGAEPVGEGIVRQLLGAGARVIVPAPSQEKLVRLREQLDPVAGIRLTTLLGDLDSEASVENLREDVTGQGSVDGVIASMDSGWEGPSLVKTSIEDWRTVLKNNLTAHFLAAKAFLPVLARQPGSSYLFIHSRAALTPLPNSGLISIAAAAQLMLKDVLVAEQGEGRVRINSLVISTPVISRVHPRGNPAWLTVDDIGAYSVYLTSAETIHGRTIILKNRIQVSEIDSCKQV